VVRPNTARGQVVSQAATAVEFVDPKLFRLDSTFERAGAALHDPYVETQQQEAAVVWWSYMNLENFARRIRDACIDAALQAYDDAGVQGLCGEGRWEAAVSALRTVDLRPVLREFQQSSGER